MTNKEIAERLRGMMNSEWAKFLPIRELADELDPPRPKVDRTLRGPVAVNTFIDESYYRAEEDGIWNAATKIWSWGDIEKKGFLVRPLVRRWEQLVKREKQAFINERDDGNTTTADLFDLAIDIALRAPEDEA